MADQPTDPPPNGAPSPAAARWIGAKDLIADGVQQTSHAIERSQRSLTRRVFSALSSLTGAETKPLEDGLWMFFAASHGNVRLWTQLSRLVLDTLVNVTDPMIPTEPATPVALRSDAVGSQAWLWDGLTGLVNGVVGDHLVATNNPLAMRMQLRFDDAYLAPVALAKALSARAKDQQGPLHICLFIHGLTATEWGWAFDAEQQHGDAATTYGDLVASDLGRTVIHVRYNSGLHISDNGQQLAGLLAETFAPMAADVGRIDLIGHSMGGLLARSTVHYGGEQGHDWPAKVGHIITLGSPHDGAPLERVSQLAARALGAVDLPGTQVPADVLSARSAGIKDLHDGTLTEADRQAAAQGVPQTGVIIPEHVRCHRVLGTMTVDPSHPMGKLVGDSMVLPNSASGPNMRGDVASVGGVSHVALANHPAVYAHIRRWLETAG
ncbi:MAG: hypothetical protein KC502_18820 [Myxococcales bacterium]|nr:hypothetical protein [Myxococcales bacterium]